MTTDRAKRYAANRQEWAAALPGRNVEHQTHAEIVYASLCEHMRDLVEWMYTARLDLSACSCRDGATLECHYCGVSAGNVQYLFDPKYGGVWA